MPFNTQSTSSVLSDGSNSITFQTSGADAGSNTSTRIPVASWMMGFNGTTWDRIRTAITSATSTLTGVLNNIPLLIYNTSAPSLTNGQVVAAQCDSTGAQKTNPGIYNGIPVETSTSVTTSSTQILAANSSRTFLFIQNHDASNTVYIATDGNAAVADGTCTKIGPGGSRTWEGTFVPSAAVFGIGVGGTIVTHAEEAS
jgi:hypothetical protein